MSDHYHYEYAEQRHDHRGDYAEAGHDHYLDYAEKHHRHYDEESRVSGLREDLGQAEARIADLEGELRDALNRIHALEDRQPDYADPQAEAEAEALPCCAHCVHEPGYRHDALCGVPGCGQLEGEPG